MRLIINGSKVECSSIDIYTKENETIINVVTSTSKTDYGVTANNSLDERNKARKFAEFKLLMGQQVADDGSFNAKDVPTTNLETYYHTKRVANAFIYNSIGNATAAVAWLHDVVEDTSTTLDDLRIAGFKPQTVQAVEAITKLDTESYHSYIERVHKNPTARLVKFTDLCDNLRYDRLMKLEENHRERLLNKYASVFNEVRKGISLSNQINIFMKVNPSFIVLTT